MGVLKEISKLKKTAKYIKCKKENLKIQKTIREIEREKKEEEYFSKNERKNLLFFMQPLRLKNNIGVKTRKEKRFQKKMSNEEYNLYFSK